MLKVLLCGVLLSVFAVVPGAAQEKQVPNGSAMPGGASLCTMPMVPPNLVANCGFETGTFSSWSQWGAGDFTGVTGPPIAHSGLFGAFFGPIGAVGGIEQFLATAPGQNCSLRFWLRNNGVPNEFQVWWNNILILDELNLGNFDYSVLRENPVVLPLPAPTSANTEFAFGFQNDPDFIWIDDIVVQCS